MDNQQLCLTEAQKQVLLSGLLGDGCIPIPKTTDNKTSFLTNCKFKEYLEFKKDLLGDLCSTTNIHYVEHNGYSQTEIYTLKTRPSKYIGEISKYTIEEILTQLNELGLALWIYDDGSLHKDKLFYNLNTQGFSLEIQESLFVPFFNKLGIYPKITKEIKRDGRIFYYLRIGKYDGAHLISKLLNKYPIDCYAYKRWSSETIQKWSKLQEKLKSMDIDINKVHRLTLSKMLKEISI